MPLIEERLQDFRPKELVQIADAYVARGCWEMGIRWDSEGKS